MPPAVPNRVTLAKYAYALSFERPLARRLFKILRPALLAIRARKPWRFLRTRLDGWNVRFIACSPVFGQTHMDSKPVYISDLSFKVALMRCQRASAGFVQQIAPEITRNVTVLRWAREKPEITPCFSQPRVSGVGAVGQSSHLECNRHPKVERNPCPILNPMHWFASYP